MDKLEALARYFRGRRGAWVKSYRDQNGEKRSFTVKEKLTEKELRDHLNGKYTVGVFVIDEEQKCYFAGWDFDSLDEETQDNIHALCEVLEDYEIDYKIHFSGKKGYHVIYHLDGVPSIRVYPFNRVILEEAQRRAGRTFKNVESFPKQPVIDPEKDFGNALTLPWGKHPETGKWANFVDMGFEEIAVQEDEYESVVLVTEEEVMEVVKEHIEEEAREEKKEAKRKQTKRVRPLPCTLKLHEVGIPEGHRHVVLFLYAVQLKELGFDKEFVDDILLTTNAKYCRPPLHDQEVLAQSKQAFKKAYKGLGCDNPLWAELYCGEEEKKTCPYYQKSHFPFRVQKWLRTNPSRVVVEVNLPNGGWKTLDGEIPTHLAGSKAEMERRLFDEYGYVLEDLGVFLPPTDFKQKMAEEVRNAEYVWFDEDAAERSATVDLVKGVIESAFRRELWADDIGELRDGHIAEDGDNIAFSLEGIGTLLHRYEKKTVKRPELAIILKQLGFTNKQVKQGRRVLRVWLIPKSRLEEGL